MFKEKKFIYIEAYEPSGRRRKKRYDFFESIYESKEKKEAGEEKLKNLSEQKELLKKKKSLERIRTLKEEIEEKEEEKREKKIIDKLREGLTKCPKCRSTNKVERVFKKNGKEYLGYKCLNCGHKWIIDENKNNNFK